MKRSIFLNLNNLFLSLNKIINKILLCLLQFLLLFYLPEQNNHVNIDGQSRIINNNILSYIIRNFNIFEKKENKMKKIDIFLSSVVTVTKKLTKISLRNGVTKYN